MLFHQVGEAVARFILYDEFHLRITVSESLPERTCDAIRRRLDSRQLRVRLGQVIRALFRHYPPLRNVRLQVTR
jgi:hypothetical protein